mgnify:CR=1 FL=1
MVSSASKLGSLIAEAVADAAQRVLSGKWTDEGGSSTGGTAVRARIVGRLDAPVAAVLDQHAGVTEVVHVGRGALLDVVEGEALLQADVAEPFADLLRVAGHSHLLRRKPASVRGL